MFCRKCGEKLEENAVFCPNCGTKLLDSQIREKETIGAATEQLKASTPVQGTNQPTIEPVAEDFFVAPPTVNNTMDGVVAPPKKRSILPVIVGGGVILLALAVGVYFLFYQLGASKAKDSLTTSAPFSIVVNAKEEITILFKDGRTEKEMDYHSVEQISLSDDQQKMIFSFRDGEALDDDDNLILYFIDEFGVKKIGEEISFHLLSSSGDVVFYLKEAVGYEGKLYKYTLSSGKEELIYDQCYIGYEGLIWSSFNGESFAYLNEDEEALLYIKGKEAENLGEKRPVLISDDGKTVIYTDPDEETTVYRSGGKETILMETGFLLGGNYDSIYSNLEMTQILYYDEDSYYIYEKGKEPIVLNLNSFIPFMPAEKNTVEYGSLATLTTYSNQAAKILPVSDLREYYLLSTYDGELLKLGSDYSVNKITNVDYSENITKVGNTLYFIKNRKLYSYSDKGEKTKLASMVQMYGFTDEGTTLYYLTEDRELYMKKGDQEAQLVEENVIMLQVDGQKTCYFLLDGDSTIYGVQNGKAKMAVGKTISSDGEYFQYGIMMIDNGKLLYLNEEGDLYCATDGKEGVLLIEDVKGVIASSGMILSESF